MKISQQPAKEEKQEKTGRMKEGGTGEGSFERFSTTALSFFIPYVYMVASHLGATENAGDKRGTVDKGTHPFFLIFFLPKLESLQENKGVCVGVECGRLYTTEWGKALRKETGCFFGFFKENCVCLCVCWHMCH